MIECSNYLSKTIMLCFDPKFIKTSFEWLYPQIPQPESTERIDVTISNQAKSLCQLNRRV